MTALMVALGAAVGAPLRYLVDRHLPCGTLTVNIAGSFLLGVLLAVPASPALVSLLGTGFCGALTTYSTFSLETVTLAREGRRVRAFAYVAVSLIGGFLAAGLGLALGRSV